LPHGASAREDKTHHVGRAVKRAALEAVVRDGIMVQPAPTFHALRHSHASARLGHRDVTVTARIYVHAYESSKRSTIPKS
jgi:integrase